MRKALFSAAIAAILLTTHTVTAEEWTVCLRKNGSMYRIGPQFSRQTCMRNQTQTTINSEGPQGVPGEQGPPGPQGDCACSTPSPTPVPTPPPPPVHCSLGPLLPLSEEGSWMDGANVLLNDDLDAEGTGVDSIHLAYNFGIDLPTDAVITGIRVDSEGFVGDGFGHDIMTSLSGDDASTFTPEQGCHCGAARVPWTTGGSGDTWGRSWLPSEFSNANFAVRVRASVGSSPHVDFLAVTIYYDAVSCTP